MRKKTTNQSRKVLPFPVRAPQTTPKAPTSDDGYNYHRLENWPPNNMNLRDGDVLQVEPTDFIEPGDLITLTWPDESNSIFGYFDVTLDTCHMQLWRPGFGDGPNVLFAPGSIEIIGRVRCAFRPTADGDREIVRGCKLRLGGGAA
jgi:hypothetical protein